DPALSEPVLEYAQQLNWQISFILNTHHHQDHVGGNIKIKQETGCKIIGPLADAERIPGIDILVGDQQDVMIGKSKAHILDVPGHTRGHIAYHFADDHVLFCGDSLFVLGCGRMFEGTAEQMWNSLTKMRALSDETQIYCAHEYSKTNAEFALTIDPDNILLRQKFDQIKQMRKRLESTVPSRLGDEKQTNPFLRADDADFIKQLGMEGKMPFEVFGALRLKKDCF
ncbi:MAG: hydroxyacylglutathione hydrolase, partial [Pseudomonadota bacterium]